MVSYNRVILTGRVATLPRCHYRPDGSPVIQFPLELNEARDLPDQDQPYGERRHALTHTGSGQAPYRTGPGSLIHIVAIGKLAKLQLDLQSGQHLLVVGRLNQRSWKTPEGKNRTRTEVIAMDFWTIDETEPSNGSLRRGERHEETD